MTFRLIFPCTAIFIVTVQNKILPTVLPQFVSLGCDEIITAFQSGLLAILPQSVCAGCNEIVTTFLIEKPTSQGMARPCFGKWGSSN
jgi:hypothetical protein